MTKAPSIKRLTELLRINVQQAEEIRRIIKQESRRFLWKLKAIDKILGTFGVETIALSDDRLIYYCNAGAIYATTIVVVIQRGHSFHWTIACWGDYVKGA